MNVDHRSGRSSQEQSSNSRKSSTERVRPLSTKYMRRSPNSKEVKESNVLVAKDNVEDNKTKSKGFFKGIGSLFHSRSHVRLPRETQDISMQKIETNNNNYNNYNNNNNNYNYNYSNSTLVVEKYLQTLPDSFPALPLPSGLQPPKPGPLTFDDNVDYIDAEPFKPYNNPYLVNSSGPSTSSCSPLQYQREPNRKFKGTPLKDPTTLITSMALQDSVAVSQAANYHAPLARTQHTNIEDMLKPRSVLCTNLDEVNFGDEEKEGIDEAALASVEVFYDDEDDKYYSFDNNFSPEEPVRHVSSPEEHEQPPPPPAKTARYYFNRSKMRPKPEQIEPKSPRSLRKSLSNLLGHLHLSGGKKENNHQAKRRRGKSMGAESKSSSSSLGYLGTTSKIANNKAIGGSRENLKNLEMDNPFFMPGPSSMTVSAGFLTSTPKESHVPPKKNIEKAVTSNKTENMLYRQNKSKSTVQLQSKSCNEIISGGSNKARPKTAETGKAQLNAPTKPSTPIQARLFVAHQKSINSISSVRNRSYTQPSTSNITGGNNTTNKALGGTLGAKTSSKLLHKNSSSSSDNSRKKRLSFMQHFRTGRRSKSSNTTTIENTQTEHNTSAKIGKDKLELAIDLISKRLSLPANINLPHSLIQKVNRELELKEAGEDMEATKTKENELVRSLINENEVVTRRLRRQSLVEIGFGKPETYVLLEKLGEGTYASVYKGRSLLTNRLVALKEIRLEFEEGTPCTAIREISILKDLKHSNIVTLHDVVYLKQSLKLVFEYVPRDLAKYMVECNNAVNLYNVMLLMFQLLRGLHFCHARRILHRDLKPQNLLVTARGELKLADFGLARSKSVPTRTFSNEVVTLWYRPPDVLEGSKNYNGSIDMWGVGCIFFELLTGGALFPGSSAEHQLKMIRRGFEGAPEMTPFLYDDLNDTCQLPPNIERKCKRHDNISADFLGRFLKYQPNQRISAYRALHHVYFNSIDRRVFQLPDTVSIFDVTNIRMVNEKPETVLETKIDDDMPMTIYEEMIFPPLPKKAESKGELSGNIDKQSCAPKQDDSNIPGPKTSQSVPNYKKDSPVPPPLPPFPKSFTLKSSGVTKVSNVDAKRNNENVPKDETLAPNKSKTKAHVLTKSKEVKQINGSIKGSKSNDLSNFDDKSKSSKPSLPQAINNNKNVGKDKLSKHSFDNSLFLPFLMPQLVNNSKKCNVPVTNQLSKASTKPNKLIESDRSKSQSHLSQSQVSKQLAHGQQIETVAEVHVSTKLPESRPVFSTSSGSAATSKTISSNQTNSSASSYSLVSSSLSNSTHASSSGGGGCTSNDMSHPRLVKLSSAELPKPSLVIHPKSSVAHYLSSL